MEIFIYVIKTDTNKYTHEYVLNVNVNIYI